MTPTEKKLYKYLQKNRFFNSLTELGKAAGLEPSRSWLSQLLKSIEKKTDLQIVKHTPYEAIFTDRDLTV